MSNLGAAPRAAAPVSNARAEASRRNGANSRGPKTPEGKARSAQNALKHGMRAAMHVVLPDENAVEFNALQAALFEELAPEGALQTLLARRVAIAAWRLARADRMEAEVLEVRGYDNAGPGVALIRDGNGTRSFETLLRYRGAAMAELMRALRTLKALLQAEAAAAELPVATPAHVHAQPRRSAARLPVDRCLEPNEPESRPVPHAERSLDYILPDAPAPGRALHEPAAPRMPNEPEGRPHPDRSTSCPTQPRPGARCTSPRRRGCRTNPSPATVLAPGPAFPVEGGDRKRGVR